MLYAVPSLQQCAADVKLHTRPATGYNNAYLIEQ